MNAGTELDALIANKIFGWPVLSRAEMEAEARSWWKKQPQCREFMRGFHAVPGNDGTVEVEQRFPAYSTDISKAWDVVEKLGLWVIPSNDKWLVGREGVEGIYVNDGCIDGWLDCHVEAATAPHAICLAALRTIDA